MLTLSESDTVVHVDPNLGGSILSFAVGGAEVLRPAPFGTQNPLQAGCFPLVPWVNRVAHGKFTFRGQEVGLAPTLQGEPLPLHGHGWMERWDLVDKSRDEMLLSYLHHPDAWPWAYESTQRIRVESGRLTLTLSVTNLTDEDMPFSCGFHPYFELPARVSFNVDGMWETDAQLLPTTCRPAPTFRAHDVGTRSLDNSFTGWDRRAVIDGPVGRIQIQSSLDLLHVYSPRSGNAFCLEPVSAAPDALNHPDRGLGVLAPGEVTTAWMKVQLTA